MVQIHINGRIVSLRGGLEDIRVTNNNLTDMIFGISMTVMTECQFFPKGGKRGSPEDIPNYDTARYRSISEDMGVSKVLSRFMDELRWMVNQASTL